MDIKEAIDILDRHNRWRRGADIDMIPPKALGNAIDTVVKYFRSESNKK